MSNDTLPVTAVSEFVTSAKSVGIYNGSQATNLSQALRLALDQVASTGTDTAKLTVADARAGIDEWLDDYGANNKASVNSIATYKGRARKLLDDFVKWNGGNYMEWKRTIAKTPKPAKSARKPKVEEVKQAPPSNGAENGSGGAGEHVHTFRLPNNKSGKLILPDPITKTEITAAWKVLSAYKSLLEAQAAVDETTEGDEETADGEGDSE